MGRNIHWGDFAVRAVGGISNGGGVENGIACYLFFITVMSAVITN